MVLCDPGVCPCALVQLPLSQRGLQELDGSTDSECHCIHPAIIAVPAALAPLLLLGFGSAIHMALARGTSRRAMEMREASFSRLNLMMNSIHSLRQNFSKAVGFKTDDQTDSVSHLEEKHGGRCSCAYLGAPHGAHMTLVCPAVTFSRCCIRWSAVQVQRHPLQYRAG